VCVRVFVCVCVWGGGGMLTAGGGAEAGIVDKWQACTMAAVHTCLMRTSTL
jgi:hypothetical protein